MLKCEGSRPEKLAYDRPSEKLIGFLRKHFGLAKYVPQNNNFVVFDAYWQPPKIEEPNSAYEKFKNQNEKPPLNSRGFNQKTNNDPKQ